MPLFRQTYGEVSVPPEAVAGVGFEPERRRGRHRPGVRRERAPARGSESRAAAVRPSRRPAAPAARTGRAAPRRRPHGRGVRHDEGGGAPGLLTT
nr:hypothetical protein [Streptomyces sp. b94]